jgi:TolA-binding protein
MSWLGALCAVVAVAVAQEPAPENPFRPFDRAAFEAHVRSLGADDARMTAFGEECEDTSVAIAADDLLRAVVPAFDTAVELAMDGDPRAALALAELVTATEDPFVRAHARYHLGRVFLDGNDPEKAVELFADFLREDRNRTPLDPEVAFFYATALAEVPAIDYAARAFEDYLLLFPDAPERMRALAAQRKAELEAQFQNPLHEIADVMKGVERDLEKSETGKPTQEKQGQIVTRLQEIIEELERREQQAAGAAGGNSPSSSPAAQSALPTGASRVGSLGRVPGVADRWGDVKDRDREAIESEVQVKLPGRMRALIQDYYDKLGKGREK